MVYDMALRAWHGLCSGLVGMAWYVVLLGGPGMVYGYVFAGMAWCMVLPGEVWDCIWCGLAG